MKKTAIVTARNTIARRLREHHGASASWRATAREFGISAGMALRIANQGYWPKDKTICKRLTAKMLPAWVGAAADWLAARMVGKSK